MTPPLKQRPMRLGLRTKIILWAFVPTAIILVLVALVTFAAYQNVTESLVLERDRELTRLAAGRIGTTIQEYGTQLAAEARRESLVSTDSAIRQAVLERARSRLFIFDAGLVLLDNQGIVQNTTSERKSMVNQNWSRQSIFLNIIQSRRQTVSGQVIPVYGTDGTIAIGVPILKTAAGSEDELWGVLVGLFQLGETSISTFYGDIVRLRVSRNGLAYLVDSQGQVIYHSESSQIGEDYAHSPIVQQVLGNVLMPADDAARPERTAAGNRTTIGRSDPRSDARRTNNQDGVSIVAAFAPIPGTGWGLVTEARWWALLSASQEFQPYLLSLLLLGILAPAVFVAVGVRRIIQPINQLISGAQTVAAGDFSQRIETKSGDEIETLAAQFNYMSGELRSSYTLLEKRVEERTRDLTILNHMAESVNQSLDLDDTLQQALAQMCEALQTGGGGIYLFDEPRSKLHLAAHIGLPSIILDDIQMLDVGEGFNGFVAETGCPLSIDDIGMDGRLTRDGVLKAGLTSLASVPLWHKEEVVGTLYAVEFRPRLFTDQDLVMLTSIGNHAAIAIENARLYQQAQELAAVQERSRLARELHDSVTQSLYSLTLLAEGWRRLADDNQLDSPSEALTEIGDLGKQALKEMRLLVYELRPPDLEKEGLLGALHKRLSAVEKRAGIDARLIADNVVTLPSHIEEHLFWIAQEALANALKHAGATQVRIRLNVADSITVANSLSRFPGLAILGQAYRNGPLYEQKNRISEQDVPVKDSLVKDALVVPGGHAAEQENHSRVAMATRTAMEHSAQENPCQLTLEIEDNGCGFDTNELNRDGHSSGGMGLITMQERAAQIDGTLAVESTIGQGTTVRVCVTQVTA